MEQKKTKPKYKAWKWINIVVFVISIFLIIYDKFICICLEKQNMYLMTLNIVKWSKINSAYFWQYTGVSIIGILGISLLPLSIWIRSRVMRKEKEFSEKFKWIKIVLLWIVYVGYLFIQSVVSLIVWDVNAAGYKIILKTQSPDQRYIIYVEEVDGSYVGYLKVSEHYYTSLFLGGVVAYPYQFNKVEWNKEGLKVDISKKNGDDRKETTITYQEMEKLMRE